MGKWLGTLLVVILLSGCASLETVIDMQKPDAKVVAARLTGINFDEVTLEFDLELNNPNPIAINSSGFTYDLALEGNPFLAVDKSTQEISIPATGTSIINLPVAISFVDAFNLISSLKEKDEFSYEMVVGFVFELPVIGNFSVPVKHQGSVPIPKLPKVELKVAELKGFSFAGAEFLIGLEIENQSKFSMLVNQLDYQIELGDFSLASGALSNREITGKESKLLQFPIKVSFLESGLALYNALKSNQLPDVNFKSSMDIQPDIDLFDSFKRDYDLTLKLSK